MPGVNCWLRAHVSVNWWLRAHSCAWVRVWVWVCVVVCLKFPCGFSCAEARGAGVCLVGGVGGVGGVGVRRGGGVGMLSVCSTLKHMRVGWRCRSDTSVAAAAAAARSHVSALAVRATTRHTAPRATRHVSALAVRATARYAPRATRHVSALAVRATARRTPHATRHAPRECAGGANNHASRDTCRVPLTAVVRGELWLARACARNTWQTGADQHVRSE